MSEKIWILDNIIEESKQKDLINYVKREDLIWIDQKNITGDYGGNKDSLYFPAKVHSSNEIKDEKIKDIINDIQKESLKKIGFKFIKNYRYKINWTSPIERNYDPMDLIHIDTDQDHLAIVYYINNSTGNTILHRNREGDNAETFHRNKKKIDKENFREVESVKPKQGRVVVFDGRLHHYGDYPEDGERFIININLAAIDENIKKPLI